MEEIIKLVTNEKKIHVIRTLREITGFSLRGAKTVADAVAQELSDQLCKPHKRNSRFTKTVIVDGTVLIVLKAVDLNAASKRHKIEDPLVDFSEFLVEAGLARHKHYGDENEIETFTSTPKEGR